MTRDEIIRMAREAGFTLQRDERLFTEMLERFFLAAYAAGAAAEREACAKVCDDKAKETFSGQCQVWGDYFARAIRARGQA